MAVHFLISAAARTLSLREAYSAGEVAAYETFKRIRWTDGEASCPRCGSVESYEITTRRKFKCAGCGHQFSVTSGTNYLHQYASHAAWLEDHRRRSNGVNADALSAMRCSLSLQGLEGLLAAIGLRMGTFRELARNRLGRA